MLVEVLSVKVPERGSTVAATPSCEDFLTPGHDRRIPNRRPTFSKVHLVYTPDEEKNGND